MAQTARTLSIDLSASGTLTSPPSAGTFIPIYGDAPVRLSMAPYWPGANSPLGTFAYYGSNDFNPNAVGGPTGNWTDITSKFSSKKDPDGTTANGGFAFDDWFGYAWLCIVYTRTSGGASTVATFPIIVRG